MNRILHIKIYKELLIIIKIKKNEISVFNEILIIFTQYR